jgi:hypothetical protein
VAGSGAEPSTVTSVILNVTVANSTAGGYITVHPSAATSVPTAKNINFMTGQTIPDLVVVPVTDGVVDVYNLAGDVDVLADLAGYYSG